MSATAYCIQNGNLIREEKATISINNRSFRYGDGCFETMKMVNGNIALYHLHIARLLKSLQLLQFEVPTYFTAAYLMQHIENIAIKNNHTKLARIRLTVYRGNGGLYDAENNFPNYSIQTWALNNSNNKLNENGLDIDICTQIIKSHDVFSNVKSNNYLGYAMAALWAKNNYKNDAIICNAFNHIVDATIANIFIVKNSNVYTPPLADGCVEGIVRGYLLQQKDVAFTITEKTLSKTDIEEADEIFLTNSIYGIRWVKSFGNKMYNTNTITQKIYSQCIMPLVQ
jgi:aminodeoxychorismate lyase